MKNMGDLAEKLLEELECETVFTIPVFGGIHIDEATVVSWIIMAVVTLLSICLVRGFRVHNPGRIQQAIEAFVSFMQDMFHGMLGKEGQPYVTYMCVVLIYIGISNVIGIFGMKPPTKDLNVTVGLSLMSIILIEYAGMKKKGLKKWAKGVVEPVPVVAPLNLLEIFIRPLSLCMRLFGNVLGAFVVMELVKTILPVGLPIPFSMYFDIFDGLIQAYVFVFLTSLFIKEALD